MDMLVNYTSDNQDLHLKTSLCFDTYKVLMQSSVCLYSVWRMFFVSGANPTGSPGTFFTPCGFAFMFPCEEEARSLLLIPEEFPSELTGSKDTVPLKFSPSRSHRATEGMSSRLVQLDRRKTADRLIPVSSQRNMGRGGQGPFHTLNHKHTK